MSLFVVEGSRKSGKTYFVNSQTWFPVFKFDFNSLYNSLKLPEKGKKTHHIGLGKELMIHQLNRDGFLSGVMMDRGIITNSVWGILNGRVTEAQVFSEIDYMLTNGLFKNTIFFLILGTHPENRAKDVWDHMDERIPEEMDLFIKFFEYIGEKGVKTHTIKNEFDPSSLSDFQSLIKNLK
jgi:hypothetical protein